LSGGVEKNCHGMGERVLRKKRERLQRRGATRAGRRKKESGSPWGNKKIKCKASKATENEGKEERRRFEGRGRVHHRNEGGTRKRGEKGNSNAV